jgi:hypothetical protein
MRQMIRVAVLAGSLGVLAAGIPAAAEKSTPAPDAGEQIKDGAIQVGQGIKRGAINLWEATKSAFSTGADKLSRSSKGGGAPSGETPQPEPRSPPEK